MSPRRRGGAGRSFAQLVGDFGGQLPTRPDPPARPGRREEYALLRPRAPRRGHRQPGHGWSPVPAPLVAYRASTAEVGGVWPLIAGDGLPPTGALIGYDTLTGGGFCVDPIGWVLADPPIVTNPNMIFFGEPGQGKSAAVKLLARGLMLFGVKVLISGDVKCEYDPLCQAVGVAPIRLGPGRTARVNPLDFGALAEGWEQLPASAKRARVQRAAARWITVLRALIGARDIPVRPSDEAALQAALAALTGADRGADTLAPVTLPQLWQTLRHPDNDLARACRYADAQHMLDATRDTVDALGALVTGPLAGLCDAPTTITLDPAAPLQSLALEQRLGDDVFALALICLNSWIRGQTEARRPGEITMVVRDEAWRQMRLGLGAVQSLDADLRLSRNDGQIQVLVAHKPSDLLSVGDAGSREVAIAKDLMALCDTKILFGQDAGVADELADLVGLSPLVRGWVTGWATQGLGRAVWQVGGHVAKVQTVRTPQDAVLLDTNTALRPRKKGRR